ncbi:MAG: hypothetical protein ACK4ND_20240 [Cytophagaceae bacterium]
MFVNEIAIMRLFNITKIFTICLVIGALMAFSLEGRSILPSFDKTQSTTLADSDDNGDTSEERISEASFEAVIPFIQVDLNKGLYLILNKPFVSIPYKTFYSEVSTCFFNYFKILFSYVISPNAP